MDEFWIFLSDPKRGDVFTEEYEAPRNLDTDYKKGIPLVIKKPMKFSYKYSSARKTDLIEGVHPFPIVSQRFTQLVSQFEKDLEFHPVSLVCSRTGEEDKSYSFMNILKNVPCFDWKRSEYETIPGMKAVAHVTTLVIEPKKLAGRHLARIAEVPLCVLASDRLKRAVEEAGLTGVEFGRLEDFRI